MQASGINLLLLSLSGDSQRRMLAHMTHVDLPLRAPLYIADETPSHVYLLTSGLASVVSTTAEGTSAEVGMIGREGLVGVLHALGPFTDPADCFMQTQGTGWKMALSDLVMLVNEIPELRSRVLEFSQCYSCVLSQIACCNRLHEAEPRLARWLLMARERLQTNDLPFTHDLLGILMGTSRPTVSLAIGELQASGIVKNARGHLLIPKPEALRELACDCLTAVETRVSALYTHTVHERSG